MTPRHSRPELQSIQVLCGMAALMVVFLHVGVTEVKFGGEGHRWFEGFSVGNAGVDIFFVISGFIMVYTASRRAGSVAEAARFLAKRGVRIYPTYWVYGLLVLAAWLIVPPWVNSSSPQDPNLWASFLLLPADGYPLLLVAWTLEFEMVFYVLFASAMMLPARFLLGALLGALGGLMALGLAIQPSSEFESVVFSPLLSEFAAGCLLGALHLKRDGRARSAGPGRNARVEPSAALWIFPAALLLIAETAGLSWVAFAGIQDAVFARPLTYGLAGALLVHGTVTLEKTRTIRFPRLLLAIGDSSYSLYLSHILVLAAVGRIWQALGLDVLPNFVFAAVLVSAAVIWGLISFRYVEKPLVTAGRRLLHLRTVEGERRLAW